MCIGSLNIPSSSMGEGLLISPFYRWRLLRVVVLLLDPSCPGSHALEGFEKNKLECFPFRSSSSNQHPSIGCEVPATKGMCPLGACIPLLDDHTMGIQNSGIFCSNCPSPLPLGASFPIYLSTSVGTPNQRVAEGLVFVRGGWSLNMWIGYSHLGWT